MRNLGYMFHKLNSVLAKVWTPVNYLNMRINGVRVGRYMRVAGLCFVRNQGRIVIGSNVRINSALWANPIGGTKTVFQCLPSGEIVIGDGCAVSNVCFSSVAGITLEKNVSIGSGSRIFDSDFHPIDPRYRYGAERDDSKTRSLPVRIKEGAFIGADCLILKGVTIGKYSVVGASSVVTKSIPDGEIWAGNPARKIKSLDRDQQ